MNAQYQVLCHLRLAMNCDRHIKFNKTSGNGIISVTCPACSYEFPMSSAVLSGLRANIADELRADLKHREQDLQAKLRAVTEKGSALAEKSAEINQRVEALVEAQLKEKLEQIRNKEARKAADVQAGVVRELEKELQEKADALKRAHEQELTLRREKRRVEEAKEALDLEVQRTLDAERGKLRAESKAQADEENRLKIAERDKHIEELKIHANELQRKVEQGPQQRQGEVLELDLEQRLRNAFPRDKITEVSKGIRGGDVVQEVMSNAGRSCGKILYETKRTKSWSDGWVAKLKEDMRKVGAAIGVIVTEAMPSDVDAFCERDGVWVTSIKLAIPLAYVLRCGLQEVAIAHGYRNGAKEKMELLYDYLTGNEFRQRVCAMFDTFLSMQSGLAKERAAATRAFNKREKEIHGMIENMAGMIGDVEGISGNALCDIPALQLEDRKTVRKRVSDQPGNDCSACDLNEAVDRNGSIRPRNG